MAFSGSLNFISASDYGMYFSSGLRYGKTAAAADSTFIPVDFVGLNTVIFDRVNADGTTNFLGETTASKGGGFPRPGIGIGSTGNQISNKGYYFNTRDLVGNEESGLLVSVVDDVSLASGLNALLLGRNGPYQHPTWKQYRGGDHKVARFLRLNNTMSIDRSSPDPHKVFETRKQEQVINEDSSIYRGSGDLEHFEYKKSTAPQRFSNLKNYYEPSVVSKHKPFIYEAIHEGESYKVRMSLMNQMTYFTNDDLNSDLKMASADPITGSLEGFSRPNQNLYQMFHTAKELFGRRFIYAERMFPKSVNAYRAYKLTKPNYEEECGLGYSGYDRETGSPLLRSFWRNSQGGGSVLAVSDGTTRLRNTQLARTSGDCNINALNSQGQGQRATFSTPLNTTYTGSRQLIGADEPAAFDAAQTYHFLSPGVITNQKFSAPLLADNDTTLSGTFAQLNAYQPYPLAMLSMWPLDPRNDIYSSPSYLTSSIGGKGLMIGLTPHSSTSSFVSQSINSWITTAQNMITRSAGELVYSTKPTIFFNMTGAFFQSTSDAPLPRDGYQGGIASMQYNRHTFPYNTPFYVTNKVRQRNPMFDTYADFIESDNDVMQHIGKDYSIIPEFRITDHLDYYINLILQHTEEDVYKVAWRQGTRPGVDNTNLKIIRSTFLPFENVQTKLNNLTIDGAEVTSSSTLENLLQTAESTLNYRYDNILGAVQEDLKISDHHYASDPTAVAFYEKFSHTDTLINFAHLLDQKGLGFVADKFTVPDKITFKCHGLKKLLPYNGFYPVLKTMQIGNNFKNAFKDILEDEPESKSYYTVSSSARELATLLEPMMAPGVLYNSIKSGVGVSYPVYYREATETGVAGRPVLYYAPTTFVSGVSGGTEKFGGQRLHRLVSASLNYGGLYMMGSSRSIPTILNNLPNRQFSFEKLYKRDGLDFLTEGRLTLVSDFVDMDRTFMRSTLSNLLGGPPSSVHPGVGWIRESPQIYLSSNPSTRQKEIFYSSVNNFLCETMQFFLEDTAFGAPGQKLPVVMSSIRGNNITVNPEKTYYMEVSLEMGKEQVMCEGPRDAGIGSDGGTTSHTINNAFTANSMMRGYIYGPPVEIVPHSGSTIVEGVTDSALEGSGLVFSDPQVSTNDYESYFGANLQDPAYQAFTPPYFYGPSSMVLAYKPKSVLAQATAVVGIPTIRTTIEDLSFYFDQYNTGSFKGDRKGLCLVVPSNSSVSSGSLSRMKIDQSIDILENDPIGIVTKGQEGVINDHVWYISPKWVCPVLDFSSSTSVYKTTTNINTNPNTHKDTRYNLVTNSYHNIQTGRGLWGGYGTNPYDESAMGIIYNNENIASNERNKGIYLHVRDIFSDKIGEEISTVAGFETGLSSEVAYYTNISSSILAGNRVNTTGSLTDKLGFTNSKVPLGVIAEKKIISEAVVLIPYFEEGINIHMQNEYIPGAEIFSTREIIPGKHFLPIHKNLFENILSMALTQRFYDPSDSVYQNLIGMPSEDQTYAAVGAAKNTDVGKMIDLLLGDPTANFDFDGVRNIGRPGYQLPPEFDFIHNAAVNPFQMLIIPMRHVLDRQELIDIYQGIMPDSSFGFDKHTGELSINPAPNVGLGSLPWYTRAGINGQTPMAQLGLDKLLCAFPAIPQLIQNFRNQINAPEDSLVINTPTWLKTPKDFYRKLKFMTFKVKQRSEKDYEMYKMRQIARAINSKINQHYNGQNMKIEDKYRNILSNRKVKEIYGANWPYDNFSLIETVKIDVEIEVIN